MKRFLKYFSILFFCFSLFSPIGLQANLTQAQLDGINKIGMSPEEQAIFQQVAAMDENELQQLWNVIEQEVSSLPPEQQDAFWKEVEDTAEVLEQELGPLFKEESPVDFARDTISEPETEVFVDKDKKPKKVEALDTKKEEKEKVDEIISRITSILNSIENFLRKTQIISGFSISVNSWVKHGKIVEWQEGFSWPQMKKQIESLVQKLSKLQDRDPKTKKYKYIDNIIENETLYNNLGQFSRVLSQYEPKIEVPEFDPAKIGAKLTRKSKKAIQKVLGALSEAIFVTQIPAALNGILKGYEPRAKELTKEAVETEKRALAEAKKPREREITRAVGRPPKEHQPFFYDGQGFSDFGTPAPYRPKRKEKRDTKRDRKKPVSKKAPAKKAPAKKPEAKKKEPEKVEDDPVAKKQVDNFVDSLTKAKITEGSKLARASNFIRPGASINKDLVNKVIPDTIEKIGDAITAARGLKSRLGKLKPQQVKKYKGIVKATYDQFKISLSKIRKQIASINRGGLTHDQQYAYFAQDTRTGIPPVSSVSDDIKKDVKSPESITDIIDQIDELNKVMKGF